MMNPQMPFLSLAFWCAGVIFLFLKMHALDVVQAYARKNARVIAVPEDAKVFGPGAVGGESDLLKRADACWRNDLQNIPMFLLLSLAYLLVGASPIGMALCIFVFCAARTLHSVAYLGGLQPWRTLSFTVGLIASLGAAVGAVVRLCAIASLYRS